MRTYTILVLVLIFCVSHQISVQNNRLVDAFGRERIYHGVNLVYKSAPYVPLTGEAGHVNPRLGFTDRDADLLRKLGQNVVRLGVMWPGVEPLKGEYNMTYVAEIRKIVDLCREYGIYVVMEFHQDAFSEAFCGEGVPFWGVKAEKGFPWPVDGLFKHWDTEVHENQSGVYADVRIPSIENCQKYDWGRFLFSRTAANNYEYLYTNKFGLRDSFANYWGLLAREFKDDDNVIAFELMNEPNFTWSIYIYPGLTDSHFLQEFYDAVVERIHQEDPSRVILFEPTTWSNQYTDFVITKEMFKSRLSHPPGGLEYSNRSVLAFHYYPWVNKLFNSTNPRSYFDSRVEDMHHLGVGGFVTEFSSAGSGDAVVHGMNMDIMDELLLSSMQWTYKGYLPTQAQTPFVPTCTGCGSGIVHETSDTEYEIDWKAAYIWARTYAQAVQGQIHKMKFNSTTNQFTLTYMLDTFIKAPTEVFYNTDLDGEEQPRYEEGKLNVHIHPEGIMRYWYKTNSSILIVEPIPTLIGRNIVITLTISPQ